MSDQMKIQHTIAVQLDPAAWELNYGITGEQAIREDFRTWVHELVFTALVQNGVITEDSAGAVATSPASTSGISRKCAFCAEAGMHIRAETLGGDLMRETSARPVLACPEHIEAAI